MSRPTVKVERVGSMKTKRDLMRRGHFGFTSVDPLSGYELRYEQTKDGFWCYFSETIGANGMERTLGQAKKDAAWFVPWYIAYCKEKGQPIVSPEREPVCQSVCSSICLCGCVP